jgi:NAD(P)-dependent dehydrogenase (short-subunit alcohol dehydrogenase family)
MSRARRRSWLFATRRANWERTFNVCWYGVYFCARAFLPLLIASPEGCIVNISSINGIVALDPNGPHTAYSSAKFAVKGFSEALLIDLRVHAPHVSLVLVMPGHIGTSIFANTLRSQGIKQPKDMNDAEVSTIRAWMKRRNIPDAGLTDQQVRDGGQAMVDSFRDNAPVSAAQAAELILRAVREKRWRLLIGEDARFLDQMAREHPEELYDLEFLKRIREEMPGRKR